MKNQVTIETFPRQLEIDGQVFVRNWFACTFAIPYGPNLLMFEWLRIVANYFIEKYPQYLTEYQYVLIKKNTFPFQMFYLSHGPKPFNTIMNQKRLLKDIIPSNASISIFPDSFINETNLVLFMGNMSHGEIDCCVCTICLEKLDYHDHLSSGFLVFKDEGKSVVTMNCGHRFHRSCINDWMNCKKYCPNCRNDEKFMLPPLPKSNECQCCKNNSIIEDG